MSDPIREWRTRISLEKEVLAIHLPGCETWERGQDFYVDYRMETTEPRGVFQLRVHASPQYPCAQPGLHIISPKVLWLHGGKTQLNQLSGATHAYHTAGTSPDGRVAICHCRSWSASDTIFEVFRKGITWVRYYLKHLQTGKTIDELLKLEPPETQETTRGTAT